MDLELVGVRAVVTAASSGLGRACAEALTAEGASVFVCPAISDGSHKPSRRWGWRVASHAT